MKLGRVLILDTETTGIDPSTSSTIEIGCILYDIKHGCGLVSFSSLLPAASNHAESINRIPAAVLDTLSQITSNTDWYSVALETVHRLYNEADLVLAHNADFDRQFVPKTLLTKPWVCTKDSIKWPRQTKEGASLVNLALEHGLGVSHAHRALTDCDLIARLLTVCHEGGIYLPTLLEYGLQPRSEYQALVSYDDREQAKAAGFRWDGERRMWTKKLVESEIGNYAFRLRKVPTKNENSEVQTHGF